jgi:hypothetical protein
MDSDSDFYGMPLSQTTSNGSASHITGDEETTSALEARVNDFDVVAWWDRQNTAAGHFRRHASPKPPPPTFPAGRPHDPYQGEPGARQLSETIEQFLARLPPATTDWRPGLDWIWISNPYAPPSPRQALNQLLEGGEERLALFTEFEAMTTAGGAKPLTALQRDVANERRETVEDLRELAGACNVLTGKWMLFPEPAFVNEVWAKVAKATANDELGVTAKVEPRVQNKKERLVCIYTRDFRNKDDVARVLNRMRELELVRPSGKQIYYKSGQLLSLVQFRWVMAYQSSDAWTHLGIYGGNSWGIGASMVSTSYPRQHTIEPWLTRVVFLQRDIRVHQDGCLTALMKRQRLALESGCQLLSTCMV